MGMYVSGKVVRPIIVAKEKLRVDRAERDMPRSKREKHLINLSWRVFWKAVEKGEEVDEADTMR